MNRHFAMTGFILKPSEDPSQSNYRLVISPVEAPDMDVAIQMMHKGLSIQYPDCHIQEIAGLEMEACFYQSRSVH